MARSAAIKSKGASQGQLRLEAAKAAADAGRPRPPVPAAATAPPPAAPLMQTRYADERERSPFGKWLVEQKQRDGIVGALAAAAIADRSFPKLGSPDDVRTHIGIKGGDPEMFEAIDDAESAWLRG